MKHDYDLAIIGGGSAGIVAAEVASNMGVKAALIEAERIGGDCLWTGCVPSKTLLASARVANTVRNAASFGINVDSLSVDATAVWARISRIRESIAATDDSPGRFRAMGVDVIEGRARFTGGHRIEVAGRTITAKYALVCTGSRPAPLDVPGLDASACLTSEDIFDSWESVSRIGFDQAELHPYAGPGHWNDPDMLVVGMWGKGHVGRGGLTEAEYRSHFALWCLLAAPLMIGCDVRRMDDFTHSLLIDGDLIAINQDPLGRQGYWIAADGHGWGETCAKPLADGSWAVGFFNTGDLDQRILSVGWEHLGLDFDALADVHNLTTGEKHTGVTRSFSTRVDSHDVHVIRVRPAV
ncbi:MAG: FAD-dependent oxidoreductase [Chloroflexi bacterium]|nr:FAD-dependent oxidoreductase [Chloroflexota bacterium]